LSDGDGSAHDIAPPLDRCRELAARWGVTIDEPFETDSSIVAFGRRRADAVVLKVARNSGDEWRSGDVLHAFGGRGVVRALEHVDGAVLLERLRPGTPLSTLTGTGRDDEATSILADVIAAMAPSAPPAWCPTVADWGSGFRWYVDSGDTWLPPALVARAAEMHAELCASQRSTRLLHGDLQHYNVLADDHRGWVAIDPKGVVGEAECELAAGLRNPADNPETFAKPEVVARRITLLCDRLGLDADRTLRWAYALGVLSAIWHVQDGYVVDESNVSLRLVRAIAEIRGVGVKGRSPGSEYGVGVRGRSKGSE
jgi:streptomycin 6-kinase